MADTRRFLCFPGKRAELVLDPCRCIKLKLWDSLYGTSNESELVELSNAIMMSRGEFKLKPFSKSS